MSLDFWDALGESSAGWWAPGIPKGKFWFALAGSLALEPGNVAEFTVERRHIPDGYGPLMLWLTSAGCDREDLVVTLIDGEETLYEVEAIDVPQGLVAVRGVPVGKDGKDRAARPLEGDRLRALVQYHGPMVAGGHALVRPTVLLTRET